MAALGLLLVGCSASPPLGPIGQDPAPPTVVRVEADWDDVQAAAVVAAAKTETVVLGVRRPDDNTVILDVGTIRDEPVEVTARRLDPKANPDQPVEIELTCVFGHFGDGPAQSRFLSAMTQRLEDLKGVDYRKVR